MTDYPGDFNLSGDALFHGNGVAAFEADTGPRYPKARFGGRAGTVANDNSIPPDWSYALYKFTMLFAEHERAMADAKAIIRTCQASRQRRQIQPSSRIEP